MFRVGILAGGLAEKEASLRSANTISNALTSLSIEHAITDYDNLDFDYVFNVSHGGIDEGGFSQRMLETRQIRHSSTTSRSAFTLMHKYRTMRIAQKLNITTPYIRLIQSNYTTRTYPHIVKDIFGSGSSLGTYLVTSPHDAPSFQPNEYKFYSQFIHGVEYTSAVLHNQSLGGCLILYDHDFCSYDVKYKPGFGLKHPPVPYHLRHNASIADQSALALYRYLQCTGLVRFDFMLADGTAYFLEGNPNPGMTDVSLVPDIAMQNLGWSYSELLMQIMR